MSNPRPTPETDKVDAFQQGMECGGVNLGFARKLERERDEAREKHESLLVQAALLADEVLRLRALARELRDALEGHDTMAIEYADWQRRAKAALAKAREVLP